MIEPPNDASFSAISEHRDEFRLVVEGHNALSSALHALIAERLVVTDPEDLTRLRFPTIVDLAIGLGTLDPASRSAWLAFNALRNKFAHRVGTALTRDAAQELYGSLSERHRHMLGDRQVGDYADAFDVVDHALAALFVEATTQLAALRDATARGDALHREVVDALGGPARYEGLHRQPTERDGRIENAVVEARRRRNEEGRR